jgi:hypothetical protein
VTIYAILSDDYFLARIILNRDPKLFFITIKSNVKEWAHEWGLVRPWCKGSKKEDGMEHMRTYRRTGVKEVAPATLRALLALVLAMFLSGVMASSSYADDSTTTTYTQTAGYEPYQGWQTVADAGATSGGGTSSVSGYVNWALIDPISDGVTTSDGTTWSTYSGDVTVVTDTNATQADADVPYYKNIVLNALDLDSDDDGEITDADTVTFEFLMTASGGRNMTNSTMYQNYDATTGMGGVVISTSDDPDDWSNADNIVWTGTSSNTTVTANSAGWNWARIATFSVSSTALEQAGDSSLYLVLENGVYCGNATLRGNIVFEINTTSSATWTGSLSAAGGVFSQGRGTIQMLFDPSSSNLVRDLTTTDAWMNRFVDPLSLDEDGNISLTMNATGSGGNWMSLSTWQSFTYNIYTEDPLVNSDATTADGVSYTIAQYDSDNAALGATFTISGLEEGKTYYLEIPSEFAVSWGTWSQIQQPIVYEFTVAYGTADKDALATAISEATTLASSVTVSADGNDVSSSKYWATQSDVDTLNAAITSAQTVYDNESATTDEISAALDALQSACNTFKASYARGNVNPAELEAAIAEAQSFYDAMIVSTDGTDVSVNDVWYTQEVKDALGEAITAANTALAAESPTVETYDAAVEALNSALETAEAAAVQGSRNNVVSSWNIGATTDTDVVASLYEDGILRFTGSGDCTSYTSYTSVPWYSSRTSIKGYEFTDEAVAPTNMDYWFYGCTSLTSAGSIPSSVTSMNYTFGNCSALTAAPAIPSSVTGLTYAFSNCTSLTEAPVIPEGVTSLSYTFQGCTSLTAAPAIPDGVTDLSYTFKGCSALSTASDIPSSVTNMTATFSNCTSLTEAPAIPEGVTNLSSTFQGCTALTSAPEIPDGVTDMTSTFANCSSLTAAPDIPSSVTSLTRTFSNCTSLTEAPVIPEGVTSLSYTFQGCTSLTEAPVIPDGVTDLSYTFKDCTSLTAAPDIPSSVTNMTCTFQRCAALETAPTIPEGVTTMTGTFSSCTSLTASPAIPSTVSALSTTFYGCTSLTEAGAISEGVTGMNQTFDYCTSLVEAPEIPSTVTSMNSTFANCPALTTVGELPSSLVNMTYTFLNCTSLTEAPAIPDTVTTMQCTFQGCAALVTPPEISDSAAVTNMYYTFYGCTALETAPTIPSSVTNMSYTFGECTSLTEAPLLPSSVTNRMYTFRDDNSMTVLPEGLVIPDPSYTVYGTGTFAAGSPYSSTNLLKTYITGPVDTTVSSYDWASDYRELIVVPEGIDASSVADLADALDAANEQLDGLASSEDGSDVANGSSWVNTDTYDLLSDTVESAQALYDELVSGESSATQSDVNNAIFQLKSATVIAENGVQTATTDTSALAAAIEAANTDASSVEVSDDGSDVSTDDQYVTTEVSETFAAAIAAAQAVLDDTTSSQDAIDEAVETLAAAQATFDASKQAGTVTVYSQSEGYEPYTGWQDAAWVAAEDPYYANSPSGTDRKGYPAWSLTDPLSLGVTSYDTSSSSYVTGSDVKVVTDTNKTDTSTSCTYEDPYYYKNIILDSYDSTVDNTFMLSCTAAGGAAETVDGSGGSGWRNTALYSTDSDGNPIGGIAITTSEDPDDWSNSENVVWTGSADNTTVQAHFAGADNWFFNVNLTVPANTLEPNSTYYLVLKDGLTGGWTHLWANIVFEFHTDSAGTWDGDLTAAGYGREQGTGGTKLGIMEPDPSDVTTDLTSLDEAWRNTVVDPVEISDDSATFRVHADGSGSNWQTISGIISQASRINVYDSLDEDAEPVASYSAGTLAISLANTERDAPSVDGFNISVSGLEAGKTYYLVFDSTFTPSTTRPLGKDVSFAFTTQDEVPSIADATITGPDDVTFTGSGVEPEITVSASDGTALVEGTDYTLTYAVDSSVSSNSATLDEDGLPMAIGSYTVTIAGTGAYDGEVVKAFDVTEIPIDGAEVTLDPTSATFTGSAIEPAVTVTLDGKTLSASTGYTVSYADNTDAGTATVTVTGTGAYGGSVSETFEIGQASIGSTSITLTPASSIYTGSAIEPAVTATLGDYELVAGTDYTVVYLDNVEPGTAKALLLGKGNFEGLAVATFTITGVDISEAVVTAADTVYDGTAQEPAVTVTLGDKTLTEGDDYTVSYTDNTDAGTATVTVTGAGVYTGTATGTFTIAQADISEATVTAADAAYTGSAVEPAVTVTLDGTELVAGTDYTVAYADNTEVGTATVTVTGTGNYTGTATGTFTVAAADISGATIAAIADQPYTGSAIEPDVTVTLGDKTLTEGTDYTVTYADNTEPGTATATVTGTGSYAGTATATFEILPTDLTEAVIAPIANVTYDGTAQTPDVDVTLGGVTLTAGTDYTVSYANNTDAGTATVTVTGTGVYTGEATATFTIDRAKLTITAEDAAKRKGGAEPELGYTAEGLVEGQELQFVTVEREAGEDYGTYEITVSGGMVLYGNSITTANYDITYVSGTFTIVDKRHQVTKNATEGGTITVIDSADGSAATLFPEEGATVTFRTSPDTGYTLTRMSYTYTDPATGQTVTKALTRVSGTGRAGTNAVYSFTMPDADVTLNAEFGENHRTIHKEIEGEGVLIIQDQADGTAATLYPQPGDKVRFKAIASSGYELTNLYYTVEGTTKHLALTKVDGTTNVYEFTMPNWNVTLHAVFVEK